jgi:hypothetical protein
MYIKNFNRMNISFAFSIALLAMALVGLFPSCLGQNDSCINIYTFENDTNTPNSTCGDGWTLGDLNHAGKKSFMSTQGISKFCTNVKGPATVEFWWYSNKIRNNKFLFRIDDKPETESYNSTIWEKKVKTLDKGDHTLSWTFYRGPNDNTSGWIDDLCIRQTSCLEECPVYGAEVKVTPPCPMPTNVNPPKLLNVTPITAEKISPKTNETEGSGPVRPIPIEIDSNNEFYVIQGERGSGRSGFIFPTITEAINRVPSGATIKVAPGTYKENILINKSIKLIGLNKNTTIIMANGGGPNRGINVTASDVIVRGFTIKGGKVGIKVISAANCEFSDNIIDGSVFGIIIDSCMNSMTNIFDNKLYNNEQDSIRIYYSSMVNASLNLINKAGKYGVDVDNSDNNIIMYNNINGSDNDGINLDKSSCNIVKSNIFENINYCDVIIEGGINNTLDTKCHNDTSASGPQCMSCD